ncbi:ribonuclease H2 subunit C [Chelonus insularis]|uniref:ribonuclease H2 subunit C n=1 Tax=Chelonus insularis TaxID=460826 RepID=UPI00158C0002|nr:ribonuclease H2 subunit C [Chelonus insularis]XP_034934121.1 ribonuclease H2 subunit C [Chelonus insularis]
MSLRLHIKKEHIEGEKNSTVHSIPCKIHSNGPANVSTYFTPYIRPTVNDHFDASFRGYPLHGKMIKVPKGYKGIVLYERKKPINPESRRNLNSTESFTEFTFWNYDKLPTKNDPFEASLDWIDIAEALHSPIEDSISTKEE